ncbi:heterodisulfide reductase-related iron-sulfur binding cluster [Rhizorhapis suberifaciens]|uniref:Glycerol-3-phosphate dehydrogenase subunit C n=1 Tax=Rhizorhapis suberifaciens TaxID=13656 RepID=A0A840HVS4_9SPHN|nr:heterodisulfide reductase-related iron-sulfur binding cluster [Rhizorhapis suberifaciens]MBB4641689.1 glycerol-3-phosphate dehydrogenase subunit C [Rhizorhapis suberifaciens]
MKEGSLEAPTRHPIAWQDEGFYDEDALDAELRRIFDICHGCRRCFNLCDSFPTLFDLVDESPHEDVEHLDSKEFKKVVDNCTLCDMCFMVKCPYVPPHEWNVDFPHLMLRYRAVEHKKGMTGFADRELAKTDRNGKLGTLFDGLANMATKEDGPARGVLQKMLGVDKRAHLPAFADTPFTKKAAPRIPAPNADAPGFGKRVVLYATCYGNFNDQTPGEAAMKVLAHNGVEVRIEHPQCCGMPKFENGDLAAVSGAAERIAEHFTPFIEQGFDIVPLTTSCSLMLKFEWPLLNPGNEVIRKLSAHTYDLSQYMVLLSRECGLAPIDEMPASIAVHFACHSRAQNMGPKALEMLRLIPGAKPLLTDRCSGHGGKWGIFSKNFDKAVKIGRPAVRNMEKSAPNYMVSECPLAGQHLRQVMELSGMPNVPERIGHPIEVMARAYGL